MKPIFVVDALMLLNVIIAFQKTALIRETEVWTWYPKMK